MYLTSVINSGPGRDLNWRTLPDLAHYLFIIQALCSAWMCGQSTDWAPLLLQPHGLGPPAAAPCTAPSGRQATVSAAAPAGGPPLLQPLVQCLAEPYCHTQPLH